jgi:hypothetical protein
LCGIGDVCEIASISMSDPTSQPSIVYMPTMYRMKEVSTVRSMGWFPPY